MNKKNTINYPKPAAMFFFSKGLKNEFETAVVNKPPVFEPLKFYCIMTRHKNCHAKGSFNEGFTTYVFVENKQKLSHNYHQISDLGPVVQN